MKSRKYFCQPLFKLLVVLLMLFVAFPSIGSVVPVTGFPLNKGHILFSENIQANLLNDTDIKSVIYKYFETKYESQRSLLKKEFSTLVYDNTHDWVKQENDKRDIELYIASKFDLKYINYYFELFIDQIILSDDVATVYLYESHDVVFEASAPEVSSLSGLRHIITLRETPTGWLIQEDQYEDELSKQLSFMTVSDIKSIIDENHNKDLQINNYSSGPSINEGTRFLSNNPMLENKTYNGSDAASYADDHTSDLPGSSTYNTNWYKTEESDCANFVSQAIYAGEGKTPPDASGMGNDYQTDWYYVFNNPMGNQNGSGSLAWIRVQEKFNFITGNTNKIGPYGYLAMQGYSTYCDIGIGGVVQLYDVNGNRIWDHEGIVVQINDCWSMSQVLVDAHTTNRKHYPLSNWASFT